MKPKTWLLYLPMFIGFIFSFFSICIDQNYRHLKMELVFECFFMGTPYLILALAHLLHNKNQTNISKNYTILAYIFIIMTIPTHIIGHNDINPAWGFGWIPAIFVYIGEVAISILALIISMFVFFLHRKQ